MPLDKIPAQLLDNPETAKAAMEAETTKDKEIRNSGIMGKFFGIGRSATTNYVGLVLVLTVVVLLFMGIVDFGSEKESKFSDYSDVFMPIVTTIIGFLIGQKVSSD